MRGGGVGGNGEVEKEHFSFHFSFDIPPGSEKVCEGNLLYLVILCTAIAILTPPPKKCNAKPREVH